MNTPGDSSCCAYCGLTIPAPWWASASSLTNSSVSFCCFGCRFAAKVTQSRGENGLANWTLARLGLAIFLTMNVLVFSMALWSPDLYGPDADETGAFPNLVRDLFRYLCLLFAAPVLILLGKPLLENAWDSLRRGHLTTDLLLLLGVAASYVYSAVSIYRDGGRVYFEVGCVVLILVTLGRWLEATGKLRTREAIDSLNRLLPETVRVRRSGSEIVEPLDSVLAGDNLRILPGERIPCDGKVLHHAVSIDEQILTGESAATIKEPGASLSAGTLNLDGNLLMAVSAPVKEGTLARMAEMIRAASQSKGQFEKLADRVTRWFLPTVVVLAFIAFGIHAWRDDIESGILSGLAVLVIACPCALGIATPLAVWAALGQAARAQVLFRNSETLERLAGIRAIRLDKTGTLTTGAPRVDRFAVEHICEHDTTLRQAAWLASGSNHAHCVAITDFFHQETHEEGHREIPSKKIRTLPGRGLEGEGRIYLGSLRLLEEEHCELGPRLAAALKKELNKARPMTWIGWDGLVRGLFVLEEILRPEVRAAIQRLTKQGIDVAILTGDHSQRARAISLELGATVIADLLPEDKVSKIEEARRSFGPVAMVGDGLNDAPALAASDVGIAMGCGADVSRDSAGVCLMGNDLLRLPWAIELARKTVSVVRQNLFWSLIYNMIGVGLALSGLLNPVWAALAMVLSSFIVVSNSMRLLGPGNTRAVHIPASSEMAEVQAP